MMHCDQCQKAVQATSVHLLTEVRSTRICMVRAWGFCSVACRDQWWMEPTSEPFRTVHNEENPACGPCPTCATIDPARGAGCEACGGTRQVEIAPPFWCHCGRAAPVLEPDRDLTVFVVHHDRAHPRAASKGSLSAEHHFDCPCEVNRWWTDPAITVPNLRAKKPEPEPRREHPEPLAAPGKTG